MILDHELEFSNQQAVTASAPSQNVIDFGAARGVGVGAEMFLHVNVAEAFAASGAATVQIQLQQSSDEAFGSPEVVADLGTVTKAAGVAGYEAILPLPLNISKRYARLLYTVANGPLTAGKISAHIVDGYQKNTHYPDAI